jgi:UDP-2,3-diacylglucosamine pyrophosphatase LpxH
MAKSQTILVISDLHCPYQHPDAISFLKYIKEQYSPTHTICIGDCVDYHALSYHESNPNLASAGDELKKAVKTLKELYKIFPTVDLVESNHGSLVLRKALSAGIPSEAIKSYNDILQAPLGWRWHSDLKIQTPKGQVYFCHGATGTPGKLSQQYGMSTCQGHFHSKAQITYTSTPDKLIFDAHVGCLIDKKSLAFAYNKLQPKRPILSILIIKDGIPQLVPMQLNKNGRWVK